MSAGGQITAARSRRLLSALATVAVFGAVGPLVGAVIAGIVTLFLMPASGTVGDIARDLSGMAYPLGILPALVAGIAVALLDRFRPAILIDAALIGLAVGGLYAIFFGPGILGLTIVLACVAASAACWRLSRWTRSALR